jgi:hypothetical protein
MRCPQGKKICHPEAIKALPTRESGNARQGGIKAGFIGGYGE